MVRTFCSSRGFSTHHVVPSAGERSPGGLVSGGADDEGDDDDDDDDDDEDDDADDVDGHSNTFTIAFQVQ